MVGESIKVTITQSDKEGVGTYCEIGELNTYELMAAVGTLVSDCVKASNGKLDVENFEVQRMNSQLAIRTIKESCYQVGYPTHDKEHERRKLINQSCDYAIECINKLNKIEQIVRDHDNDSMPEDYWYIDKIREEVLNNESNN